MARYSIKFEVEVFVNEPDINEGEIDEVVYDDGFGPLTDEAYNQIVDDALNALEDIQNCVTSITRIDDEDEEDDDDDECYNNNYEYDEDETYR